MDGNELCYLSASELVAAYRGRALSPVEVTRAVLARIEAIDPQLNAFRLVDPESALCDARAAEARWAAGTPCGTVDGVPTSIKDIILTRGWSTLRGSRTVDPAGPWELDAPSVARLREAGAVLLGKTTTPEFGWRGTTDSPLTGVTRNPWRLDVTPGGSSGGATAAIAAGLGALAVGTDGGGSIRIPAAFTGTVGFKAQFGRVPAFPLSPMGNVAHIGPQTRTVADAALMLEVLAQPDDRDVTALPPSAHDWAGDVAIGARDGGIRGLRIAFSPRLGYVRYVDPRIERALEVAAGVFASLGAIVETADPGIEDGTEAFRVHWFASARHLLHRLPQEQLALLDPGLRAAFDSAASLTLPEFLDAQATRGRIALQMRDFAQRYDLLLTPATAVAPFAVGLVMPKVPDVATPSGAHDWSWWTPFSYPFNLTGQPALVQPCGFTDDGLPVALQLVAPPFREDLCLRAAAAYEAATDWHRRRPTLGVQAPKM